MKIKILLILLVGLLLTACESSRPFYNKINKDWPTAQLPSDQNPSYTVILVGDAGNPDARLFTTLKRQFEELSDQSAIVFLGDNIYPIGMPDKDHPDRTQAEQRIGESIGLAKKFPGKTFFIPGNHDWNRMAEGGLDAVLRQQKYIEDILGKQVWFPRNACGDPVAFELNDDVTLILFDSQWWLQKWKNEPQINNGCELQTRRDLKTELAELVDKYDSGNILLCGHHPTHTQGSHGGYFPVREHIFPLTYLSDNLYVPLPFIGSLHPIARYLGVTRQDISHELHHKLNEAVEEATFRRKNLVIASGHEHCLEYFASKDKHYIVSGSGTHGSYVKRDQKAGFLYTEPGFSKLLYYADGSVWMEFWATDEADEKGKLIFRKNIKNSISRGTECKALHFAEEWKGKSDSINYVAFPGYEAARVKRFWLGKNYREAWTADIKFPVMNMDTMLGGLTPIRQGGGQQSKTLRLRAANGKQYVFRSVQKDATPILPQSFKNTAIDTLYQDQMSMDHPYGARIVPELAEAVGVFHTNPRFYYVPKQKALGGYNHVFGDAVYLFEERPAKNRDDVASFGYSEKIVSYRAMLKKTRENHDHQIDQKAVLKARLFDILIGDWDRHDDQWRWATFKEGKQTIYRPIPRDRDHAFLQFKGALPWLASRDWMAARQLQSFEKNISYIEGLCFNARHFDRAYLNAQTREDWIAAGEEMRKALSPDEIRRAVSAWPDKLFILDGEQVVEKLIARCDKMPEFAAEYYDFLAKEVDIIGTDKRDRFEIERLPAGMMRVEMFRLSKKGKKKEKLYSRLFDQKESKEVTIYARKGDDEIEVFGSSTSGSLLRLIGGDGADKITDRSAVNGGKRCRIYDDSREENEIDFGEEARDLTEPNEEVNEYNRLAFKYPTYFPLMLPAFNKDDGINILAGWEHTSYGFRKDPYKQKHSILAQYAFRTSAIRLEYEGDWRQAFGKIDFSLEAQYFAPTNVSNFFGQGNNTVNNHRDVEDFDFNRIRIEQLNIFPSLKYRFLSKHHTLSLGLRIRGVRIEETAGRVTDPQLRGEAGLTAQDFERKRYGSIEIKYEIDKTDDVFKPTRGLYFVFDNRYNMSPTDDRKAFVSINSEFKFYYTFPVSDITLASRWGAGINLGKYDFFQAQYLGSRDNLRGYRAERFAGDGVAFTNNEIRIGLFNTKSFWLPMRVGITGFHDIGRVWLEGEDSETWHQAVGGGVWFHIYESMLLNTTFSTSEESNFFDVSVGFFF